MSTLCFRTSYNRIIILVTNISLWKQQLKATKLFVCGLLFFWLLLLLLCLALWFHYYWKCMVEIWVFACVYLQNISRATGQIFMKRSEINHDIFSYDRLTFQLSPIQDVRCSSSTIATQNRLYLNQFYKCWGEMWCDNWESSFTSSEGCNISWDLTIL